MMFSNHFINRLVTILFEVGKNIFRLIYNFVVIPFKVFINTIRLVYEDLR